jgi:hypothetical protein
MAMINLTHFGTREEFKIHPAEARKKSQVHLATVLGLLQFSRLLYLKAKYENEHLPMNRKTSWS